MTEAAGVLALWVLFAVTHMGLSSPRVRERLVAALGELPFRGLYAVVALAIFVPLVGVYFDNKHAGPELWSLEGVVAVRWLAYVGMGVAFTLVVAGLLRPSPASIGGGGAEAVGVFRITRHPMSMGMGLFGLMHLLAATVHPVELAFFGGFPVFVVLGCRHQDQRKLVSADGELARFRAQTPFLPFTGPESLRGVREIPLPIALGIALTVVVRTFHPRWFG